MRYRLTHQQLGLGPRACRPEDRDERGFSGRSIGADRLSGLRRRALDIEQVVGDPVFMRSSRVIAPMSNL